MGNKFFKSEDELLDRIAFVQHIRIKLMEDEMNENRTNPQYLLGIGRGIDIALAEINGITIEEQNNMSKRLLEALKEKGE